MKLLFRLTVSTLLLGSLAAEHCCVPAMQAEEDPAGLVTNEQPGEVPNLAIPSPRLTRVARSVQSALNINEDFGVSQPLNRVARSPQDGFGRGGGFGGGRGPFGGGGRGPFGGGGRGPFGGGGRGPFGGGGRGPFGGGGRGPFGGGGRGPFGGGGRGPFGRR